MEELMVLVQRWVADYVTLYRMLSTCT